MLNKTNRKERGYVLKCVTDIIGCNGKGHMIKGDRASLLQIG